MAAVNLAVVTRILRKYRRALFVKTRLTLPIGHSNSLLTGACLCSGQEKKASEKFMNAFINSGDMFIRYDSSYNRINGTYASENPHTIREILKKEWAYDGVLMSDWGAVHSTVEAATAGMDLEMPGPPRHFGSQLFQATHNWQVSESVVDDAARRMLRLNFRSGVMDGKRSGGELRSTSNRQAAFSAASEAITLLKNDGSLLPLDKAKLSSPSVVVPVLLRPMPNTLRLMLMLSHVDHSSTLSEYDLSTTS